MKNRNNKFNTRKNPSRWHTQKENNCGFSDEKKTADMLDNNQESKREDVVFDDNVKYPLICRTRNIDKSQSSNKRGGRQTFNGINRGSAENPNGDNPNRNNPNRNNPKRDKNRSSLSDPTEYNSKRNNSKNICGQKRTFQTPYINGLKDTVEPMVKRNFNMEIVISQSRPGDYYLLLAIMKEAQIVHNEIVRRVNNGENPDKIEIPSLREVIYFTQNGMIQHTRIHYLADIQIAHLLQEIQNMRDKLSNTRGLSVNAIHLNYLDDIRFLNFRRLGQTHWIDCNNNKIRLLGMPTGLNVRGLDLLINIPSIKVGSLRLIHKEKGFEVSVQLLIPEKDIDEFHRHCIASSLNSVNSEDSIIEKIDEEKKEELGPSKHTKGNTKKGNIGKEGKVKESNIVQTDGLQVNSEDGSCQSNEAPDFKLIETLREKFNRNKDLDKYDNTPRFLKGVAS